MARLVLIAASLGALAGCYNPQVADCVDTCGTSRLCPEGLTCAGGFCRVEGASGSCTTVDAAVSTDASTDAPAADAMGCPPVPMQQGCTGVGPPPVMPYCIAACADATGMVATMFNQVGWHPVVIQDSAKLAAVMAVANTQTAWIGLTQPPGQATMAAGWQWPGGNVATFTSWAGGQPDDGDGVENNAEQCATISNAAWSDEPCSNVHVWLIEPML